MKRGDYETNNIPTSTAFMSFLIQKQCDRHLHCRSNVCIRPIHYMPEEAPTTADFSLLSSLPPPTSEIVYCQNTTHTRKVSIWTHHPGHSLLSSLISIHAEPVWVICRASRKLNNIRFFLHRMAKIHGEFQKMTSHRWAFPCIAACFATFVRINLNI